MTAILDLEERIAALEEQFAGAGQSDQLVPNVLTVAADGSIGANLTGHVHAQGLDLDAGDDATPVDARRIRWLRTSDGALVAAEYAYLDSSGANRSIYVQRPAANGSTLGSAHIDLRGVDDALDPGNNSITASTSNAAGTQQGDVRIIDSLQRSSFPRLAAVAKWIISPVLAFNYPAMVNGGETSNTFNLAFTSFLIMLGGLATNDNNGGSELCTWAYSPLNVDQTRVTVRNVSGFGMGFGGTWQGIAIHD